MQKDGNTLLLPSPFSLAQCCLIRILLTPRLSLVERRPPPLTSAETVAAINSIMKFGNSSANQQARCNSPTNKDQATAE